VKLFDVVKYVVGVILLFALYFLAVPALISAKSTVAVVAGVFLILAGFAMLFKYIFELLSDEKEKNDGRF
jgi:predicted phage tail protein